MTIAAVPNIKEMTVRSVGDGWTGEMWEQLRHDEGIKYEIISGVLYITPFPWGHRTTHGPTGLQIEGMTLRTIDGGWTAEQWEQLNHNEGIRYEIIAGVLYMSSSPSVYHQWISSRIYLALEQQLSVPGVAFTFYSPTGVFLPDSDPLQPDLVVVRREDREMFRDKRIYGVPALLVEILSPSNSEYDLVVKREAYARAGVPEYWIARPHERDVLIHSEPQTATGQYLSVTHIAPDGELVSPTLPFRATITPFFADAPDPHCIKWGRGEKVNGTAKTPGETKYDSEHSIPCHICDALPVSRNARSLYTRSLNHLFPHDGSGAGINHTYSFVSGRGNQCTLPFGGVRDVVVAGP